MGSSLIFKRLISSKAQIAKSMLNLSLIYFATVTENIAVVKKILRRLGLVRLGLDVRLVLGFNLYFFGVLSARLEAISYFGVRMLTYGGSLSVIMFITV